jgi:hypothetical protein
VLAHAKVVVRTPQDDFALPFERMPDGFRKLARLPLDVGKDPITLFLSAERLGNISASGHHRLRDDRARIVEAHHAVT